MATLDALGVRGFEPATAGASRDAAAATPDLLAFERRYAGFAYFPVLFAQALDENRDQWATLHDTLSDLFERFAEEREADLGRRLGETAFVTIIAHELQLEDEIDARRLFHSLDYRRTSTLGAPDFTCGVLLAATHGDGGVRGALGPSQRARLQYAFLSYDKDRDGVLNAEELAVLVRVAFIRLARTRRQEGSSYPETVYVRSSILSLLDKAQAGAGAAGKADSAAVGGAVAAAAAGPPAGSAAGGGKPWLFANVRQGIMTLLNSRPDGPVPRFFGACEPDRRDSRPAPPFPMVRRQPEHGAAYDAAEKENAGMSFHPAAEDRFAVPESPFRHPSQRTVMSRDGIMTGCDFAEGIVPGVHDLEDDYRGDEERYARGACVPEEHHPIHPRAAVPHHMAPPKHVRPAIAGDSSFGSNVYLDASNRQYEPFYGAVHLQGTWSPGLGAQNTFFTHGDLAHASRPGEPSFGNRSLPSEQLARLDLAGAENLHNHPFWNARADGYAGGGHSGGDHPGGGDLNGAPEDILAPCGRAGAPLAHSPFSTLGDSQPSFSLHHFAEGAHAPPPRPGPVSVGPGPQIPAKQLLGAEQLLGAAAPIALDMAAAKGPVFSGRRRGERAPPQSAGVPPAPRSAWAAPPQEGRRRAASQSLVDSPRAAAKLAAAQKPPPPPVFPKLTPGGGGDGGAAAGAGAAGAAATSGAAVAAAAARAPSVSALRRRPFNPPPTDKLIPVKQLSSTFLDSWAKFANLVADAILDQFGEEAAGGVDKAAFGGGGDASVGAAGAAGAGGAPGATAAGGAPAAAARGGGQRYLTFANFARAVEHSYLPGAYLLFRTKFSLPVRPSLPPAKAGSAGSAAGPAGAARGRVAAAAAAAAALEPRAETAPAAPPAPAAAEAALPLAPLVVTAGFAKIEPPLPGGDGDGVTFESQVAAASTQASASAHSNDRSNGRSALSAGLLEAPGDLPAGGRGQSLERAPLRGQRTGERDADGGGAAPLRRSRSLGSAALAATGTPAEAAVTPGAPGAAVTPAIGGEGRKEGAALAAPAAGKAVPYLACLMRPAGGAAERSGSGNNRGREGRLGLLFRSNGNSAETAPRRSGERVPLEKIVHAAPAGSGTSREPAHQVPLPAHPATGGEKVLGFRLRAPVLRSFERPSSALPRLQGAALPVAGSLAFARTFCRTPSERKTGPPLLQAQLAAAAEKSMLAMQAARRVLRHIIARSPGRPWTASGDAASPAASGSFARKSLADEDVTLVLKTACDIFAAEPPLLTVERPVLVAARAADVDESGAFQAHAYLRLLYEAGPAADQVPYAVCLLGALPLAEAAENASFAADALLLVYSLKVHAPKRFFVLRGAADVDSALLARMQTSLAERCPAGAAARGWDLGAPLNLLPLCATGSLLRPRAGGDAVSPPAEIGSWHTNFCRPETEPHDALPRVLFAVGAGFVGNAPALHRAFSALRARAAPAGAGKTPFEWAALLASDGVAQRVKNTFTTEDASALVSCAGVADAGTGSGANLNLNLTTGEFVSLLQWLCIPPRRVRRSISGIIEFLRLANLDGLVRSKVGSELPEIEVCTLQQFEEQKSKRGQRDALVPSPSASPTGASGEALESAATAPSGGPPENSAIFVRPATDAELATLDDGMPLPPRSRRKKFLRVFNLRRESASFARRISRDWSRQA